jgi:serine/threonine-protein kinase
MTGDLRTSVSAEAFVRQVGRVFQVFDGATQDSGHVSYGVESADGHRYFIKTAGDGTVSPGGTSHADRVAALRRAARLERQLEHPAASVVEGVVETSDGVAVVYEWFDGELVRSAEAERSHPDSTFQRFCSLPVGERMQAIDQVVELHVVIDRLGWVIGDLYDGCLMYDFGRRRIRVVDLECYRPAPYVNEVGRLPGSKRFMAPEELCRGRVVDSRTAVFCLGRMIDVFVLGQRRWPQVAAVVRRATESEPDRRFPDVETLHRAWRSATSDR